MQSTSADRAMSRLRVRLLSSLSSVGDAVISIQFWWILSIVCAGVLALADRHAMNPDGVSYLDIASSAPQGQVSQLVNAYWSPLYPALIGIVLRIFHPSLSQESFFVHCLNFLIFVFALWSFTYFIEGWLPEAHGGDSASADKNRYILPFAFCTFLYFTLSFIGVGFVTPDLCVAGIVLFTAGVVLRLSRPGSGWKYYAALGFALGVAYYAKAAMFPFGVVLIGALFVYPPSTNFNRRKLLLSFSVFLVTSGPLIALVSAQMGKITFGETGRLNYAWYVNGWVQWRDAPEVFGSSANFLRTSEENLAILDFSSHLHGTDPLGYEPSYWSAGTKARFDLGRQITSLKVTLRVYKRIVIDTIAFLSGAIVLLVLIVREKAHPISIRRFWWQLGWPLAVGLIYALVHVEYRFLGAFLIIFWLGIYGALISRLNKRVAAPVLATVICTVMIPFAAPVPLAGARVARSLLRGPQPDYEEVAVVFNDMGIRSGDRLAVVGDSFVSYYARVARLQVAAEVPDANEFWHLSAPDFDRALDRLAAIGVKAIVATNRPDSPQLAEWRDVHLSSAPTVSILRLPAQCLNTAPR